MTGTGSGGEVASQEALAAGEWHWSLDALALAIRETASQEALAAGGEAASHDGTRQAGGATTGSRWGSRGTVAVASRVCGAGMGTGLCGTRVRQDCGAVVAPTRVRVGEEPASGSGGLGLGQH